MRNRIPPTALVMGVTGGIATGKSAVLGELRRLGAVTWSADEIAREISEPEGAAYASIVREFEGVLKHGRIDRTALAERIFGDSDARARLDRIMHPVIVSRLAAEIDAFRAVPLNDPPIGAAEIPLLFEVGAEGLVDIVVVVAAEQDRQFARLKQRTGWPEARVRAALESQLPLALKIDRADEVIWTDGSLDETVSQTHDLWERITKRFKEDTPCL